MVATSTGDRVEAIAQDLFEVVTRLCLAAPRGRRHPDDLKEIEFLTLTLLHSRGTMIVGDIQRLLGVLPAQMSRVIRSLESRRSALIECRINPQDKRKIDVCMTEAGEHTLSEYQGVRIRRIAELLQDLPSEDQDNLVHLLDKVRNLLDRSTLS
jgi:DNA-binding MarR family transcriptional regulator